MSFTRHYIWLINFFLVFIQCLNSIFFTKYSGYIVLGKNNNTNLQNKMKNVKNL